MTHSVCISLIALTFAVGVIIPMAMAEATEDSIEEVNEANEKVLSRGKRYLAFPEGSSVSAAICLTIGVIGNPDTNWLSWAVNWGVAYNLPHAKWVLEHVNGFGNLTKAAIQRRSRRSFYDQLHAAIDRMGYNGKACVARALCESAKHMSGSGLGNVIEELVKVVLTMPEDPVASHEPDKHHHYDRIYRRSKREILECSAAYPGCEFSLLELIFGMYNASPTTIHPFNFM